MQFYLLSALLFVGCAQSHRSGSPGGNSSPISMNADESAHVGIDLASEYRLSTDRRQRALQNAAAGDPAAAGILVNLGLWNEMAALRPLEQPLLAWRDRDDEAMPGVTVSQVWAEVYANWAVRQKDLTYEAIQEMLLQARSRLDRPEIGHPVILDELAWLFDDVRPIDHERARQLRLQLRDLLARPSPAVGGGEQAYRLRLLSRLVEKTEECWILLDRAASDEIDDPIARLDAIDDWCDVVLNGRPVPQLDVPTHGKKFSFTITESSDLVAHKSRACAIAARCGNPAFEAITCWKAACWGHERSKTDISPQVADWAAHAERCFAAAHDEKQAAMAMALQLTVARNPSNESDAARKKRIDSALAMIGPSPSIHRVRLESALGSSLARMSDDDEASSAFAEAFATMRSLPEPQGRSGMQLYARWWSDLAHIAAETAMSAGEIHDLAIRAYCEASALLEKCEDFRGYAHSQMAVARLAWSDDQATHREAIEAFRGAAAALDKLGPDGWDEHETALCELADRLRADGDHADALLTLLDICRGWEGRRKAPGDAADVRLSAARARAGLRTGGEGVIVRTDLDETQGPWAETLKELIAKLDARAKNNNKQSHIIARLFGWPEGRHLLEDAEIQQMSRTWHISSSDCRLLARFALSQDQWYLLQIIGATGHRPLAPVLCDELRQAKIKDFGHSAAEAFRMVAAEDRIAAAAVAEQAIGLTWAEPCIATISLASKVLAAKEFTALCRRLVEQSHGENRGILSHLINILARDPAKLPVADLRRLSQSAEWRDDRNEAFWALALTGDPEIGVIAASLLADPNANLSTRLLAIDVAAQSLASDAKPAIAKILQETGSEFDLICLQEHALAAAVAFGIQIEEDRLVQWSNADWQIDPDGLELEGPLDRYRILTAAMIRWLVTADTRAWAVIERGVRHPWLRYRFHLVRTAAICRHASSAAAILAIAEIDDGLQTLEPRKKLEIVRVYLGALSVVSLAPDQRAQAERRFGAKVPPPVFLPSPNFDETKRPCDGGPSAPIWPEAVNGVGR
jgi:hypothetical protein